MRQSSDATKLRNLKRELKRLLKINKLLLGELQERHYIGQAMANLCFNLAQNTNYDLAHRNIMDDCRKNWDKIKAIQI
jgi:hypothetical protein